MKYEIVLIGVIAVLFIGGVLFIGNSLFGNPVSISNDGKEKGFIIY